MINSRTFITIPGQSNVFHYSLYGARIYGVSRSTDVCDEVSNFVTPSGLQFNHVAGLLRFDPANPFNPNETVFVLYD